MKRPHLGATHWKERVFFIGVGPQRYMDHDFLSSRQSANKGTFPEFRKLGVFSYFRSNFYHRGLKTTILRLLSTVKLERAEKSCQNLNHPSSSRNAWILVGHFIWLKNLAIMSSATWDMRHIICLSRTFSDLHEKYYFRTCCWRESSVFKWLIKMFVILVENI